MLITMKQSAWDKLYLSHQRLNVKYSFEQNFDFNWWLVGFTDGDGCFSIIKSSSKWQLSFQISQSSYNLRILFFIKKMLGAGSISYASKNKKMSQFRIRDRKHIKSILFPLFDSCSFLTKKSIDYQAFKKVFYILEDNEISKEEKDLRILSIIEQKNSLSESYVHAAFWNSNSFPCKSWVIGFIEAEGSFYITKKGPERFSHGFGITQKHDKIVLESIRKLFHIQAKVRKNSQGFFSLDTTNFRSLSNILIYSKDCLKGVKSLEYRIWGRSFRDKGNPKKLHNVQKLLKKIRSNYGDQLKFLIDSNE